MSCRTASSPLGSDERAGGEPRRHGDGSAPGGRCVFLSRQRCVCVSARSECVCLSCFSTEIEDLEEEECSFVAELSAVYVPFDQSGEEETAPPSWRLERVPDGLKRELADFTKHRTDPLVRAREGTACVDITVGNDRATATRFFGWLFATHSITPGLGVFCRPTLSQWAEEWLRALREKGCRFSTLSNYANSLAMVGSFVYSTYKLDDETLAMPTSPLDEILRLRSQSESQAKHEGLYTKRHADWISWEEAQRSRISAEQKYKSLPASPHGKKTQALREWLAIGLFTLMPPDRVVSTTPPLLDFITPYPAS